MLRRRRLKVQWFLTVLLTLVVSGTILYKNIEFVNEDDRNIGDKVQKRVLNSFTDATTTERYKRQYKNLKKYVTKSMSELGKMDEISKHFLFLNSVPKSGSEILIFLLEKIQGVNNFKHVRLNGGNRRKLTTVQQENVVDEVYDIRKNMAVPLSFDRNVYFINFTTFDKQSPTYVNQIRDPVAKVMARAISKKTGTYDHYFLKCLSLDSKRNCNFKNGRPYDLTIPYFCGQDPRCMLLNNEWAIQTAKENVDKYYPVVGVLEELNVTLNVLENKIPQFFKGVKRAYENNLLEIYNQKKQPMIPREIKQTLEKTLILEMEFYQWIKRRLLRQIQEVA